MESDDDIVLSPSSPVHERKLKRLKKAIRVSEYLRPNTPNDGSSSAPPANSSDSGGPNDPNENRLSTKLDASKRVKVDSLGAMRVLEFDSVAEEFGGKGEACSLDAEKGEEVGDLKTKELEKKRRSDSCAEKTAKKKKRVDSARREAKIKESTSDKRTAEKERLENIKQLRAESQRLLRESRDAAFKPIPLIQKPISSVLDKIRQRKLEVLKKSGTSVDDNDGFVREVLVDGVSERACEEITDKVENAERQEILTCPADMKNNLDALHMAGSSDAVNYSSCESIAFPVVMGSESDHAFRAPIDDTQELYADSQRSDAIDDAIDEKPNSPLDVFAPSILTMNLKLDSAPLDDVSSDEEDNDKENMDPHPHGSADFSSPPSGDPVKAFVDEEAEEEDDSDNDLLRFQDNEDDDEDEDDAEELNNMIATEYEEKPIDRERRDQLHQQWLEQQDAAGMENLLQKLNCSSKLRNTSIGEEDEKSKETENESADEVEEYDAPLHAVRINLEKVKMMIPQMFTDQDDAYVSSDDEETEKRLAKQCLFDKTEEQATFLSPAEDESCREVFSLIKKLNIVPDTKRRGRTSSFLDTPLVGQNINISSKSSFLRRASNHSMPSSQKHGPSKARSFIFGRDDSNSRTSISMSEDSSDTIQMESQPPKTVSAKFKSNTQNKFCTLNSASQKSGTSLLEILRRSSLHAERCVQNEIVQQTESVFAAFKLAKKPIKTEGRV